MHSLKTQHCCDNKILLCPKKNGGALGDCISKSTRGIILIFVPLDSPTHTVPRTTADGSTLPCLFRITVKNIHSNISWEDELAGKVQFHGHLVAEIGHLLVSTLGLCKELCLYGKNSKLCTFKRNNPKSHSVGIERYATVCMERSGIYAEHMESH